MNPLQDLIVLALGDMADRPLCRFLASLGATIRRGEADAGASRRPISWSRASGSKRLADLGLTRAMLDAVEPARWCTSR